MISDTKVNHKYWKFSKHTKILNKHPRTSIPVSGILTLILPSSIPRSRRKVPSFHVPAEGAIIPPALMYAFNTRRTRTHICYAHTIIPPALMYAFNTRRTHTHICYAHTIIDGEKPLMKGKSCMTGQYYLKQRNSLSRFHSYQDLLEAHCRE